MTEEVGTLVLRDNYEQNHALANAATQAPQLLHVHEDWIRRLERQGLLDRALEALPTPQDGRRRGWSASEGLTVPELSVLLAYTKIVLADELIDTDLADDPFLRNDLFGYFPTKMRQTYRERMETTRCAGRSSSPRWSTTSSTAPASRSSTGSRRRPRPPPTSWCGRTSWPARSSGPGR